MQNEPNDPINPSTPPYSEKKMMQYLGQHLPPETATAAKAIRDFEEWLRQSQQLEKYVPVVEELMTCVGSLRARMDKDQFKKIEEASVDEALLDIMGELRIAARSMRHWPTCRASIIRAAALAIMTAQQGSEEEGLKEGPHFYPNPNS